MKKYQTVKSLKKVRFYEIFRALLRRIVYLRMNVKKEVQMGGSYVNSSLSNMKKYETVKSLKKKKKY